MTSNRGILRATSGAGACNDASGALRKDDYFLSATNPVANVDQREVENLAREVIERPELAQARQGSCGAW